MYWYALSLTPSLLLTAATDILRLHPGPFFPTLDTVLLSGPAAISRYR